MVLHQLFKKKPSNDLLNKIIKAFNLIDINDKKEFSQLDMDKNNTLLVFHDLENELNECYIPCKQKNYTNNIQNITNKEAITIFRQLLKAHDHDLYSKERFIKGIKYLVYKIVSKQEKIIKKKTKRKSKHKSKNNKSKEVLIIFD